MTPPPPPLQQVVIGPDATLPEGTVISMHHPDEEEEDDEDEFLSDAEVGRSKDQTKLKGVGGERRRRQTVRGLSCVFSPLVFNPAEVGAEGKGYAWRSGDPEDAEDEELAQCLWGGAAHPGFFKMMAPRASSQQPGFPAAGVVLKLDPESDSEDSEPDGPDDPVIPSPEMDDVKGQRLFCLMSERGAKIPAGVRPVLPPAGQMKT